MRSIKNRLRDLENNRPEKPELKIYQEPANPKKYFTFPEGYGKPRLTRKEWGKRYPGHEIKCINLSAADREIVLERRRDTIPWLEKNNIQPPDWWEVENG
jgi:hypothetical protein